MSVEGLDPLLASLRIEGQAPECAALLRRLARTPDARSRDRLLARLRPLVPRVKSLGFLLRGLAGSDQRGLRRLALDLVAILPAPLEPVLLDWIRPLVRDRKLPNRSRLRAANALMSNATRADQIRMACDFAAGFGRRRFLRKLASLQKRFSRPDILALAAERLRERLPLVCSRCPTRLPPRAMARHLWECHHRVLDGRRIRRPTVLIDRWMRALHLRPPPAPQAAVQLHRWLLRHGVLDALSLDALRECARRQHASVCPICFEPAPLDPERFPTRHRTHAAISTTRILCGDTILETRPEQPGRVEVTTPNGDSHVFRLARSPWKPSLWRGSNLWLLAALILAWWFPREYVLPITGAVVLLGVLRYVREQHEMRSIPRREILDIAWSCVPRLQARGILGERFPDFLADLASISPGHGNPDRRAGMVANALGTLGADPALAQASRPQRLELLRLQIADARERDEDDVGLLATALRPFLERTEPLPVLNEWLDESIWAAWSTADRMRFRLLILAMAFEIGFQPADIQDLGLAVPQLGEILRAEDLERLARDRLLWEIRAIKPWAHCGNPVTAFDLAQYPQLGWSQLESTPDLLLIDRLRESGGGGSLMISRRGVHVRDLLIHEWPITIEITPRDVLVGRYKLPVAAHPERLARKIRAWAEYYFQEFLPQSEMILQAPPARCLVEELTRMAIPCSRCHAIFLARVGEVGTPWRPDRPPQ